MQAVIILILLVMIGAIVLVIWAKTKATVAVTTRQNRRELQDAVTNFLAHRKYLVVSQSENLLTFAMDKSASCIIALFLFLLGLIPGILYLVLGGSTKTLTIQFASLQSQDGYTVRIQGQRSIVNRVRQVVAMGGGQAVTTSPVGYKQAGASGQAKAVRPSQTAALDPARQQALRSSQTDKAIMTTPIVASSTVVESPQYCSIKRDVMIGNQLAFSAGEKHPIALVDPDPQRPEYKYVVHSPLLNKQFRLSANEVILEQA